VPPPLVVERMHPAMVVEHEPEGVIRSLSNTSNQVPANGILTTSSPLQRSDATLRAKAAAFLAGMQELRVCTSSANRTTLPSGFQRARSAYHS
jgi:hypothetical protein